MTPLPESMPWVALLLLGAGHGINPGMGWLFAVALGMQEGNGRAVWRALPPLALGHAAAIASAVIIGTAIGTVLPAQVLKLAVAIVLVGVGIDKLLRMRHPRFGGMRVGARDLAVWSFLMASAHGAGLMVLPFVIDGDAAHVHGTGHAMHAALVSGSLRDALLASGIHAVGYLAVATLLAFTVYRYFGVRLLRTLWLNLDRVWAIALIITGLLTPLM
jgi:hypothetical protein